MIEELKRQTRIILCNFWKISIILIVSAICVADARSYNEIVNLKVENKEIALKHYHNWSLETKKKRDAMMLNHQNPFLVENDYAFIECIDKKTGRRLFKKPTPALTYLYISSDSKYIIGLSKIQLDNPYQFVCFDLEGNLVAKKHITPEEAKLSLSDYQDFKERYSIAYDLLISLERITRIGNEVYIDFSGMNMPIMLGKAWDYLFSKITLSHLSKNFSDSISNWVFWYNAKDPKIELNYNNKGQLIGVSLLDPKGERFEIPIEISKSEEKVECKPKCH
ncbi:MAG: hypothetical protein QG657_103 [Acidobacteriota bacterium]|nr:hypothetical protein [Acidobacteriota bacterium]